MTVEADTCTPARLVIAQTLPRPLAVCAAASLTIAGFAPWRTG